MGIAVARAKDGNADPATQMRGTGFGIKWVPYQNDIGWSLGARFDYGRTRITDHENAERFTEKESLSRASPPIDSRTARCCT